MATCHHLLRFSFSSSPKTLTTKPPQTLTLNLNLNPSPSPPTLHQFNQFTKPTLRISRPRSTTICKSSNQTVPATERVISAVAYFLPFFNGLQYGRYLFVQYPQLGLLFEPIFPLLSLYRSVPYASFVAFFALYLGVVRNPSFSRFVRFNSMQAVVLDVLLALPLLLQRVFNPGRGLGFRLMVFGYNSIFVFIAVCFLYGLGSCVLGRTPYLPFVASAADRQL